MQELERVFDCVCVGGFSCANTTEYFLTAPIKELIQSTNSLTGLLTVSDCC